MRAHKELYSWMKRKHPEPEPITVGVSPQFRIRGDGPRASSSELIASSGIDDNSWLLIAANGEPVPARVEADSGGHMCWNGVGFNLSPWQPLAAGNYLVVLKLDAVHWSLVDDDELDQYQGRPAMVRRFRVDPRERDRSLQPEASTPSPSK